MTPVLDISSTIPLPNSNYSGGTIAHESIPLIGLGTWQSKPGEVTEAVRYAIKEAGYRHIDCAWMYGNEKEVGEGIKLSGVPREEIFITSKVWSTYHKRVAESVKQTLENLGTDYLDLLLIHWPITLNHEGNHPNFPTRPDGSRDVDENWKLIDTWRQFEALHKAGTVKHIGVSNFSELKLAEILPYAEIPPAVDQLELHVYNPQHKLVHFLKKEGIQPQAYSPLGSTSGPLRQDPVVVEIAEKHKSDPAQVLIGYLVYKDIVALPKSVTSSRILANATPAPLDAGDIARLDALAGEGGKQKRFTTPPWGAVLGFDDWYKADVQKPPTA